MQGFRAGKLNDEAAIVRRLVASPKVGHDAGLNGSSGAIKSRTIQPYTPK